MNIFFDAPKTHVGFWIGNGETVKPAGVMTAYDAEGEVICTVRKSRVLEPHTVFIGIHDTLGRMVKVSLDYGKEAVSESIDDLYFAPSTTPPAFDFVGTVKGTVGSFSSFFNVGDPVQGSYAFTTPADHDVNPNIGEYRGALLSWTISVGDTLFQLDPELDPKRLENFIFVKNDAGGDIYQVFADFKPALGAQVAANWFFLDASGRALTSDALPLVPPDISKFNDGTVQVFDRKTGASAVFLQINSLVLKEEN